MAIRCCRCSPIRAIASATCSRASRPPPTWPGCTRTRRCCPCRRGPARPGITGSPADPDAPPTVTYDLNRLQGLTTPSSTCVTLNPGRRDRRTSACCAGSSIVIRSTRARPSGAQQQWGDVSGVNRTHYCGAYWCYGFHEDGLKSALRVAARARGRVVIESGLFVGTLRHRRFTPVAHAFTYPAVHGAARHRPRAAADAPVAADEPQPVELGELRRSRSSRRSEPPAQGTARRRRRAPRDRVAGRVPSSC